MDTDSNPEPLPVIVAETGEPVFSEEQKQTLLQLALVSIEHGLRFGEAHPVNAAEYPPELQTWRAVFVTLKMVGQLRGCVGTLEATRPLVCNVGKYAYLSAFSDPRFPELTWTEFSATQIQLSILNPPEPLRFQSEEDLLAQLRPGIDGLVLEDGPHHGTLLPSVWEHVDGKKHYWQQLKRKAGLPPRYWSSTLTVQRYTTCCIP